MSLFIDASAAVAIIVEEPDAALLEERLGTDDDRLCSAVSAWEAVSAIARARKVDPRVAHARVLSFLDEIECRFVAIGEREFNLAAEAYGAFGKGIDPAGLNMGDCFAYACAKANNAQLLYKGSDFDRTDLAWSHA